MIYQRTISSEQTPSPWLPITNDIATGIEALLASIPYAMWVSVATSRSFTIQYAKEPF